MMPQISVVFTSYNHREFLRQALESLLTQTFTDFELIIIDDCSTDGSQEILREYAEKDKRIKLHLLEKNTGSYVHSTNLGASMASAPYIIFEQCDDYAEPTQLEKLYHVALQYPEVGVIYSSSRMVDADGCDLGNDYNHRSSLFKKTCVTDTFIPGELMGKFFLQSCVIPNLSAALIKREWFEKMNRLSVNYMVLADWDLWFKLTTVCDFYYLREPLNNFRQHNTTIRKSVKMKRQISEVFKAYYDYFKLSDISWTEKCKAEFRIARIWLSFFKAGPGAWIKSFFPLQIKSVTYSFYFPFVFLMSGFNLLGGRIYYGIKRK